jgi:glucose/arabinose dehydrogenase
MRRILITGIAAFAVAVPVAASAAKGPPPPPPKAGGKKVVAVGYGVPTPTQIVVVGRTLFVAGGGGEGPKAPPGGVFVLRNGKPIRLPGSPGFVAGIAWHVGTLYVSAGRSLQAWSGWNGQTFARRRTIVSLAAPFTGFSGLSVAPRTGDIYTGVSIGSEQGDHVAGTTPYANDFLRINPRTAKISVVATGLRQPWQNAFVRGTESPYVSDLGQENLGKTEPPDLFVRATPGSRFGFSSCNWSSAAACAGDTRPFILFPAHSSPMGIGVAGTMLYVALFSGTGRGPEVVRVSTKTGRWTPFATGFVAPVLSVAVHGNVVYSGDVTGTIYQIG